MPGFHLLRYDNDIQAKLGSKIKPEPWMHIALFSTSRQTAYSIYV